MIFFIICYITNRKILFEPLHVYKIIEMINEYEGIRILFYVWIVNSNMIYFIIRYYYIVDIVKMELLKSNK